MQSAIGQRVTVNFEHRGKVLIDVSRIALEIVSPDEIDAIGMDAADS